MGNIGFKLRVSYFYLQIYKAAISGNPGGLLAVARGGRFLYACFMTLSS